MSLLAYIPTAARVTEAWMNTEQVHLIAKIYDYVVFFSPLPLKLVFHVWHL